MGDSDEVAAWRQRMGAEDAKVIYQERVATAECVTVQSTPYGPQR